MFFFSCHSVLVCVGCMKHTDSESDLNCRMWTLDLMAFLMNLVRHPFRNQTVGQGGLTETM